MTAAEILQLLTGLATWLQTNPAEAIAAATGLLGSYLLAGGGRWAGIGWLAFLASNAAWLWFAWRQSHPGLFLQQVGFTGSSLLGIWIWLIRPRFQWDEWRGDHNGRVVMRIKTLLRWRGRCIDLHQMVEADTPECFHTHPGRAIRVILWAGYREEILWWEIRRADGVTISERSVRRWWPGMVGLVRPELTHRIESLPRGVSYSLWIRGRKRHQVQLRGSGWPAGSKPA